MAHRQKGLLGRKWRIKVWGRRWKREIKKITRERECASAMRTVERFAGGKERKEKEKESEKEEDCAARYCEFVTELLSSPRRPFLALLPHLLSPALRSDERVTGKAWPTWSGRAHLPHFKPILIRTK